MDRPRILDYLRERAIHECIELSGAKIGDMIGQMEKNRKSRN